MHNDKPSVPEQSDGFLWEASQKLHSQSILQRFYYFAHTWLRRIQNFRSITERPGLRTCHEILQLFQIHKISLFHLEKTVSANRPFSSRWLFLFSFYYLKISFFIKYKFSIVNTKLKRIFAIEIQNLLDSKNIKE